MNQQTRLVSKDTEQLCLCLESEVNDHVTLVLPRPPCSMTSNRTEVGFFMLHAVYINLCYWSCQVKGKDFGEGISV